MDFDSFSKWEAKDKKIRGYLLDIQELLSIATKSLDIKDLESIKESMKLTLEQCVFWLEQNNIDRFVYDLECLSDSICDMLDKKS